MDLFRKTMKPVEQVLKDAGVKKDEIDDVKFCALRLWSRVDSNIRSFLWGARPEFLRFSSYSRSTSTGRSHPRASTRMRLLHTVPLFKVAFFQERKAAVVSSSSMSVL